MRNRVHELLGVEPVEKFRCKHLSKTFHVGPCGVLWEEDENGESVSDSATLASLINNPSLIIRKPHYTPEQIRVMRALVELGYRWIAKDEESDRVFAYEEIPLQWGARWICNAGFSAGGEKLLCLSTRIPDWTVPLDLLAALGNAEPVADSNPPSNYVGEAAVEYGAPFDEPLAQERRGMIGWEETL